MAVNTEVGYKICSKCKDEKLFSEFYKNKSAKDGLYPYCKQCRKEYQDNNKEKISLQRKENYKKNKEKILKQCKKYKSNNKEKIAKRNKKYYNRPEIKEKTVKYKKEWYARPETKLKINKNAQDRRKNDNTFRLSCNLRTRITKVLKNNTKTKNTTALLGCTIKELKLHLQRQFTKGMSWDNYGNWHVDHIKPCILFDLSKKSEQLKCFNYTNLQPLWAEDNLKKGDKYEEVCDG